VDWESHNSSEITGGKLPGEIIWEDDWGEIIRGNSPGGIHLLQSQSDSLPEDFYDCTFFISFYCA